MLAKSPPPHIHFSVDGNGPPVILLHGLFGSGNNLGSLARSLLPGYRVYSVDLPNHGRSGWLEDATLARLAAALLAWADNEGLAHASWAGHSLGGKVAMEIALADPARVAALVVSDIAPVSYPPHHDAIFAALDAVVAARPRSRAEAAAAMAPMLSDPGVVQFLLMSLAREPDGYYRWRFNLDGIRRDYGAVRAAPAGDRQYPGPTLFVKGGDSDYILPAHREQVIALFPQAQVKVMPGCGHWLHAEQPERFNGIVTRFLERAIAPAA